MKKFLTSRTYSIALALIVVFGVIIYGLGGRPIDSLIGSASEQVRFLVDNMLAAVDFSGEASEALTTITIGNLSCAETDNRADFKVKGTVTVKNISTGKVTSKKTDFCSGNVLTEFYCDNSSVVKGFFPVTFKCSSCSFGQCANLACDTSMDCNDRDMYTIGTCNSNKICEFKKIQKYYELVFDRVPGESGFKIVSGAIKSLTGTENFNTFFARDDMGYVIEATNSSGGVVDSIKANIWQDYITAYKTYGDEVIYKDILTVRIPQGKLAYKKFAIYSPDKKNMLAVVDPANLPVRVATTSVEIKTTQQAVVTTANSGYPKSSVTLPSDFLIDTPDAALKESTKQEAESVLSSLGPKTASVVLDLLKGIAYKDSQAIYAACGGQYDACYVRHDKQLLVQIPTSGGLNVAVSAGKGKVAELPSLTTRLWLSIPFGSLGIRGDLASLGCSVEGVGCGDIIKGIRKFLSPPPDPSGAAGIIRGGFDGVPFDVIDPLVKCFNESYYGITSRASAEDQAIAAAAQLAQDPCVLPQYPIEDGDDPNRKVLDSLQSSEITTPERITYLVNARASCPIEEKLTSVPNARCKPDNGFNQFIFDGQKEYCVDKNNLKETVCDSCGPSQVSVSCGAGCEKGACKSCSVTPAQNFLPGKVTYYDFPSEQYKTKPTAKCKDSKTLATNTCDAAKYSQPVEATTTCKDLERCGTDPVDNVDKCLSCPAGSCKIGTGKCDASGGKNYKCKDLNGDGCGEWKEIAPCDGYCYDERCLAVGKCVVEGWSKCVYPNDPNYLKAAKKLYCYGGEWSVGLCMDQGGGYLLKCVDESTGQTKCIYR